MKTKADYFLGLLKSRGLLRNLPGEALCELAQAAEEKIYPKGAVIFQEGKPADFLWWIEEGWVQLVKRIAGGKVLTLDLVTPKEGLCGLSAFHRQPYLASAVAAAQVKALRFPAQMLRKFLERYPRFASSVMEVFDQRFRHMATAYANAFAPAEQRIALALLQLDGDFGATLPVTRREVAQLAGTTVETAIRVTNQMRRENLLSMRRGQIALINPKGLERKVANDGTEGGRE